MSSNDNVNNPSHYQTESGLEAIEVIEAFFEDNYHLGNAFKYMARAGKKNDELEDIEKAIWYLERYKQTLGAEDVYGLTPKGQALAELIVAGYDVPITEKTVEVYAHNEYPAPFATLETKTGTWVTWYDDRLTTEELIEDLATSNLEPAFKEADE